MASNIMLSSECGDKEEDCVSCDEVITGVVKSVEDHPAPHEHEYEESSKNSEYPEKSIVTGNHLDMLVDDLESDEQISVSNLEICNAEPVDVQGEPVVSTFETAPDTITPIDGECSSSNPTKNGSVTLHSQSNNSSSDTDTQEADIVSDLILHPDSDHEYCCKAPPLKDMNQIDSEAVEHDQALALMMDGRAHIVSKLFIEQVGEDVIDISDIKVAITCPLCFSIRCTGPDQHKVKANMLETPLLSCLPVEIFLKILKNLTPQELCTYIAPVCRSWRKCSLDASLWTRLDLSTNSCVSTPWLNYILKRNGVNVRCLKFRGRTLNLIDIQVWSRHLPHLVDLNLAYCSNLNVHMLTTLHTNCPRLKVLNLEGVKKISMEEMEVICRWPLESISLCYCERTEGKVVMYMVRNIATLTSVNINGIADTQDSVIQALATKYQHCLEYLDLDGEEMSDDSFQYISLCTKLRRLTIHYAHYITDKTLPAVLNLSNLSHLKIRDGKLLTSAGISKLFRGPELRGLRELDLSECSAVEDTNVIEAVSCCGVQLTSLNLSWTYLITDTSFDYIITHCPNLERLLFVGNKLLHGGHILAIAEYMPKLVLLNLEMCDGIDDEMLIELVRMKPDLKITNYYGEILQHESAEGT